MTEEQQQLLAHHSAGTGRMMFLVSAADRKIGFTILCGLQEHADVFSRVSLLIAPGDTLDLNGETLDQLLA